MNANEHKPLTSFLSPPNTGRSAHQQSGAGNAASDLIAKADRAEIFPGADNSGQMRTSHPMAESQISPGADNSGQMRTGERKEGLEISSDADISGQVGTSTLQLAEKAVADASPESPEAPPRCQRSDEILAVAIANGAPLCRAAERAGVNERTARRRWAEPAFRQKVLELRCEMRCLATGQLTRDMDAAVATLHAALNAKSESVRVSAARAILKIGPDLGGRAEENALLAGAVEKLQEQLTQATRRNGE